MATASGNSAALKEYNLSTNLAELPNELHWRLAGALNFQNVWMKIIDYSTSSAFSLSVFEYDRILRAKDQGSSLLHLWGNRGQTIKHLLQRLQSFSKIHGSSMDGPQLALRRKFVPVVWSAAEQATIKVTGNDERLLQLVCRARGFPWPRFLWMEDDKEIEGAHGRALIVPRCGCRKSVTYKCKIWNQIEEGFEYSAFYRKPEKLYHSELLTEPVDLSSFITDDLRGCCERCAKHRDSTPAARTSDELTAKSLSDIGGWNAELVAADKVALIISNCNYVSLPSLVTPHFDAEMLADSLQNLGFKTVALGDLNLAEMLFFINEYRKLLGDGVYAVFYFVGHGFERNGKNYLLAVDASDTECRIADCVSVEWILANFEESHPALNLILLDICRKNVKCSDTPESSDCTDTEKIPKIARNTVCGYATSSGVSAFEVRGEKNGVFMKHLLQHITDEVTVLEMLTKSFQEIANDARICDMQIPELKSNLVLPRGLRDPLVYSGHTASFNSHTLHWRYMHELPNPVHVRFEDQKLSVIIWYDYAGHFTNKVYVFSSVGDLADENDLESLCPKPSPTALLHVAHLRFSEHYNVSMERVIEDGEEGISMCVMLSNLQRPKGAISCTVVLSRRDDDTVIASKSNVTLGNVLITRIYRSEYRNANFCYESVCDN